MTHGVILAGGSGTRLHPHTQFYNKQMLPLYNKFIIDFPISTIKSAGVENLTVVLGGNHHEQVVAYLKDGSDFGLNINYCYQSKPIGIAQGINLCKNFIKDDFVVVLGDNIFQNSVSFSSKSGSQIVLYDHPELNRFGVASLENDKIVKIEEKPKNINIKYKNYAITGCYLFDQNFFEFYKNIVPSARGEYEITSILDQYLNNNQLSYVFVDNWADAGTFESIAAITKDLSK